MLVIRDPRLFPRSPARSLVIGREHCVPLAPTPPTEGAGPAKSTQRPGPAAAQVIGDSRIRGEVPSQVSRIPAEPCFWNAKQPTVLKDYFAYVCVSLKARPGIAVG